MSYMAIKRKLIIVFMTEDNENSELFNRISLFFQAFNIKNQLRISNRKLQVALKSELPPLNVLYNSKSYDEVIHFDDTCIRFCVHDSSKRINANEFISYNSHVIEIIIGEPVNVNPNNNPFEFSINIQTTEELFSIVEDVMLDIQMFYHYGYDKDFQTITERKQFSQLKVDFCNTFLSEKIQSKYYSFSTFCKNGSTDLDYNEYVKLWNDFSTYLKKNKPSSGASSITEDIVNRITSTPIYGKQISPKELTNKLNGLKPGKYLFVYLKTRPRQKKTLSMLQPLFSGTKLKRGSFEIVPYEMRCRYERHKRYISFYYFEIT